MSIFISLFSIIISLYAFYRMYKTCKSYYRMLQDIEKEILKRKKSKSKI